MTNWLRRAVALGAIFFMAGPVGAGEAGMGDDEFLNLYYGGSDLVETASRAPKPLNQVPENVSVITAAEIERMNPHGLDDILNRLPGVRVSYRGKDFNASSYLFVQGASEQQTILLVDGVRIAIGAADLAYANVVPVGIIKRIEVIRGAASSTWGSALGGVINIITKEPGTDKVPQGSVRGTYGEFGSQEYSGEAAGAAGPVGYYLNAGHQESDGIRDNKIYENNYGFAKAAFSPGPKARLQLSGGHTNPEYVDVVFPAWGEVDFNDDRTDFGAVSFDYSLRSGLDLHLDANFLAKDFSINTRSLANPSNPEIVNPWYSWYEDQRSYGVNGRLVWQGDELQVVTGLDYLDVRQQTRGNMDLGTPEVEMEEELAGLYLNATWSHGPFTLVPGLRYDYLSEVDNMLSPSLGLVYALSEESLLRATAGRGYRKPPLSYVDSADPFGNANPNLQPERVWSGQLGLESTGLAGLHLKADLFFHEAEDSIYMDWDLYQHQNGGTSQRRGLELSLATPVWHDLSLAANFTYLHNSTEDQRNYYQRWANLILTYDNPAICTLELAGHYIYYDYRTNNPADDTILWDLAIGRDLWRQGRRGVQLFMVGRNLTNEEQYEQVLLPNAPRWLEAGLKIFY
ncbi:MAG: TonB-dependent receptor [Thermodesulfobacteriota bacterium]